jgi:hypothetical protein
MISLEYMSTVSIDLEYSKLNVTSTNCTNILTTLPKNPYPFQVADDIRNNYHKCVCGSDVIYYRIMTDYVEISTIIGSQDFQNFE